MIVLREIQMELSILINTGTARVVDQKICFADFVIKKEFPCWDLVELTVTAPPACHFVQCGVGAKEQLGMEEIQKLQWNVKICGIIPMEIVESLRLEADLCLLEMMFHIKAATCIFGNAMRFPTRQ